MTNFTITYKYKPGFNMTLYELWVDDLYVSSFLEKGKDWSLNIQALDKDGHIIRSATVFYPEDAPNGAFGVHEGTTPEAKDTGERIQGEVEEIALRERKLE